MIGLKICETGGFGGLTAILYSSFCPKTHFEGRRAILDLNYHKIKGRRLGLKMPLFDRFRRSSISSLSRLDRFHSLRIRILVPSHYIIS